MEKRTIVKENEISFNNSNNKGGNMNYFWFTAFITKEKEELYISLGINGNHSGVSGRYDQRISVDEAKDIVKFLTGKIEEFEKVCV